MERTIVLSTRKNSTRKEIRSHEVQEEGKVMWERTELSSLALSMGDGTRNEPSLCFDFRYNYLPYLVLSNILFIVPTLVSLSICSAQALKLK